MERIELLDADDGGVLDLVLLAEFEEVVIHLAGAEDEPRDAVGVHGELVVVEHLLEGGAFGHVLELADGLRDGAAGSWAS